jgi:chaperonin GroEL (HSP60 family)
LFRILNLQVLEENERSIHDALCVVRSLFKKRYTFNHLPDLARFLVADKFVDSRFMIAGGSAVEMEVFDFLCRLQYRFRAFYKFIIDRYTAGIREASRMEQIPGR